MIKIGILAALWIAILGFTGMVWSSERGSRVKGVNEEVYYGLFVISFMALSVIAPLVAVITVISWVWI